MVHLICGASATPCQSSRPNALMFGSDPRPYETIREETLERHPTLSSNTQVPHEHSRTCLNCLPSKAQGWSFGNLVLSHTNRQCPGNDHCSSNIRTTPQNNEMSFEVQTAVRNRLFTRLGASTSRMHAARASGAKGCELHECDHKWNELGSMINAIKRKEWGQLHQSRNREPLTPSGQMKR
eukprot:c20729_g1_i4.p1 GENE.c20729_g1_i4~~c20729_g1_i4.p1  ORF type:complete len:181 (+),score=11.04 c20729_g1_i4:349-891(+)